MPKPDVFIFEVSQKNFQSSVVENSRKLPVLVEFMGVWSGPCIAMSDNLTKLATEMIINLSNMLAVNEPELSKESRQRLASQSN